MKGKKGHFDFSTSVFAIAAGIVGYIIARKHLISKIHHERTFITKNPIRRKTTTKAQ